MLVAGGKIDGVVADSGGETSFCVGKSCKGAAISQSSIKVGIHSKL